ncbi:MAG: hypothetical protein WD032_00990 [Nitrospirales bacterium]
MRTRLRVFFLVLSWMLSISLFSTDLFANPTFLNRQSFPLHLGLTEIGRLHQNDLKTFEVWTQWNNPSHEKIEVKITFTFFDKDSADSQLGEDGTDDTLMTVTETVIIPEQVNNWGKFLHLTAIGEKLNQGFDHPAEGAGLELYLDAQVISVKHLPSE